MVAAIEAKHIDGSGVAALPRWSPITLGHIGVGHRPEVPRWAQQLSQAPDALKRGLRATELPLGAISTSAARRARTRSDRERSSPLARSGW